MDLAHVAGNVKDGRSAVSADVPPSTVEHTVAKEGS